MAKDYNIRIEYLEKLRNMLASFGDPQFDQDVGRLNLVIDRLRSNFTIDADDSDSILYQLDGDLCDWAHYRRFFPKVKAFYNDGVKITDQFHCAFKPLDISHDELIEVTRTFFKEQGEFFLKHYDHVLRDAEHHISFVSPDSNTAGEMYYFRSVNEAFLFIPDNKSVDMLYSFTHESEHALDADANPDFYENCGIRETSALFMELIASDYFNEVFHLDNEGFYNHLGNLTAVKIDTYDIMERQRMIKLYKKIMDYSDEAIMKRLLNKWNQEYLDLRKDSSLLSLYFYQIPYLIVIELYKIYKTDKEKAIYILIDIILNGTDQNIFSLLNKYGIVLNKNAVEYEQSLLLKYDSIIKGY